MLRRAIIAAAAAALLILPLSAFASENGTDEDISEELERQIDRLDLSGWEEYFDGRTGFFGTDVFSMAELILKYAESGAGETPQSLWDLGVSIARAELARAAPTVAALVSAALITAIAGVVADDGIKPLAGLLLCITSVTLTAGVFAALCRTAANAVRSAGELTEKAMPVLSALLISLGAGASAGIYRPLMAFLSGTVVMLIERVELPLVLAGGMLSIIDALTEGKRLGELVKLVGKASKWLLGLISAFYFGMTAMHGMTVAARDGVSVRTAKYAIDKLVPVVGSMVSGTVDSVMGCALLVKNGAGAAVIAVLLAVLARPLIVLAAGIFTFRAAAALCQPAADPRAVKLFTNAADMTEHLFACTAVTGSMLALTTLVFIASGGITAGLW